MNQQEQFIELRRTLNKTLNELLESEHLTIGEDRVITNDYYGGRIINIFHQIEELVESINTHELNEN